MTLSKAVPKGLKPQECECGSGHNKPPIPYILEKDELQEAVKSGTSMIKLMLPGKIELRVSVGTSSTQEQFVMHVQQAISAIRQKGLKEAYKRLLKLKKECKVKLKEATLHSEFAPEGQDMTHLKQTEKTATAAYEKAKAETALVAEQVFQLYCNLIMEKARQPWTKIMQEQVEATPWTDLQGVEHAEQHAKSWDSFLECVRYHLLNVSGLMLLRPEGTTSATA